MTDEELMKRLRERPYRLGFETQAEATLRRHMDREVAADRIQALNAKLAKATDVLREILFTSNEDHTGNWLDALARGQDLMAELEKAK